MTITVEGGNLLRVMGTPCTALGYWYSPACVELAGPERRIVLSPIVDSDAESVGEFEFEDDPSALWARARVGSAFGYRPLQIADGRGEILDHGFVAVRITEGSDVQAIPFVCTAEPNSFLSFTFPRSSVPDGELEAVVNGFLAVLARSEPARFVAEGLDGYLLDEEGDEGGETLLVVGFDGNTYYNAEERSRLPRPARRNRPRRPVRRCV